MNRQHFDVKQAGFIKTIVRPDQAPLPARPTAAFVGRSNSGKSSLINSLTRSPGLARTSNTPGRTQSIVYFAIDERYYFVDLPGYGYAKAPKNIKSKWGPMIEKYLVGAPKLRLVIVILDIRRDPSPEDRSMVQMLEYSEIPYFFALTKADKIGKTKLRGRVLGIQESLGLDDSQALLPYSAVTGSGRRELLQVILQALKSDPRPVMQGQENAVGE